MTPDKLKKIKALLNSPASTDNEKEICRKLLKEHTPEDGPKLEWSDQQRRRLDDLLSGFGQQRASGFGGPFGGGFQNIIFDAAQQRQAAAQQQQDALRQSWLDAQWKAQRNAAYSRHTGQAARQQAERPPPKLEYTQEDFEKAQANIDTQRKTMDQDVNRLLKNRILQGLADTLNRITGKKK